MDYNFITDRIAVGAALQSDTDVDELAASHITHVIDCTYDSFEQTQQFALHPVLSCLWNPAQDDGATKDISWFRPSLEFGLMVMSLPLTKLYVHCTAGINRGPSTAFCLMVAMGWDPDTALDLIHAKRPATVGGVRYSTDALNALTELGYLP